MGEQRRRGGRGRSGRGGRIPRRGDGPAAVAIAGETFVSFPLAISGPLRVASLLDPAALYRLIGRVWEEEARLVAAVGRVALAPDHALAPTLGELRIQLERHREQLAQLARDLGGPTPEEPPGEGEGSSDVFRDLVARQRLAHLGWQALQNAAYASGDRRIDRAVKPVLREKERHAALLAALALAEVATELHPAPEE